MHSLKSYMGGRMYAIELGRKQLIYLALGV